MMKRILAFAGLTLAAVVVATPAFAGKKQFDDKKIVLSLGILSDVHINGLEGMPAQKFENALMQLRDKASVADPDGLDGVLFAGDIIDNAYASPDNYRQAAFFKAIYQKVFNPLEVPAVYAVGNHDVYQEFTSAAPAEAKNISRLLGPDWFQTDVDDAAREAMECRHCVIGDCHVICMTPVHAAPVVYTPESKEWLDRTLAQITAADPDRYVLLLTHPMIYGTVYGSDLGEYWYTSDLTSILEKYPQVITFGGHLHFPLNDPRSIWQGRFTALGTASVRYMAIEAGKYEEMAGNTIMRDHNEYSEGLLLQFDKNGNARFTKMDFYRNSTIGEPWEIKAPAKDGSHLKTYSHLRRMAENEAPVLSTCEVTVGASEEAAKPISFKFAAGTDDEFVHHYVVMVKQVRKLVVEKRILSDFYRNPQPSDMKKEYEVKLGSLAPGKYEVYVTAFDSWGAEAAPVGRSFEVK